ncbi:uncharacterized protein LOC117644802 [Thrips palmi]|uniref:Uncharacterized protein LOC117644802 n=1 Tax=Thrips palmi TaxID=161013 RepID=A0A6P8ZMB7_THRPL|nr:uncharacterized protein LOC117644802 [Thrips palmi]
MIQAAEKQHDYLNFSLREVCEDSADLTEMISGLKTEFHKTADRAKKIQILSVLPTSWSREKICQKFDCSVNMVRVTKALVESEGILAVPKPKQGRPLNEETVKSILGFYYADEVSRPMPGQRDYKSGKRVHKQKRLLLCTVNELYSMFCKKYPGKVSFSKFASLRPPECVSAGASGTHSVCVCAIHQNTELMAKGGGIRRKKKKSVSEQDAEVSELDEKDGEAQITFEDCVDMLMCTSKSDDCYMDKCLDCPDPEILRVFLAAHFEELSLDSVMFQQWMNVDRCSLETLVKSIDNYIDDFTDKLLEYKKHNFIAKKQAAALKECKANLKVGEVLTLGDFSENYSFLIQDAIQGFHWNNDQATLHPFVNYFRRTEEAEIEFCTLIVISDELKHNTAAVHAFQERLLKYLEEKIGRKVKKIFYWSDGAAAQYKNRKNVSNVANHQGDFLIVAEWHFFPTSHGKTLCDATAGAAKRSAAEESKRRVDEEPIANPVQLYNYLKGSSKSMDYTFVSKFKIECHNQKYHDRMENATLVPGIRSIHAIIPVSETLVQTKEYSLSSHVKMSDITPQPKAQGSSEAKPKRKRAKKNQSGESNEPESEAEPKRKRAKKNQSSESNEPESEAEPKRKRAKKNQSR